MREVWQQINCAECLGPFTDQDDWFNRHSDPEGEDIHADCCPECNPKKTRMNK